MSELNAELHKALATFAAHAQILVALDFDGTVSPLVDRPENARPLPATASALTRLGRLPGVHTALVSGRNLDSLAEVYPQGRPDNLIGSHGAERVVPHLAEESELHIALDEHAASLLASITEALGEVSDRFEGVTLEFKPASTVLHTRQANAGDAQRATEQALSALASFDGVKLLRGKSVIEASVHEADKGLALRWLKEALDVPAMLFVGDDVTDEDGFKVLTGDDLGVKVGAGETAAQFRIDEAADLPALLESLIFMRG
ncbi:trehalose-phosphatase [Glutamicibacter sp. X7]